MKSKVIFGAAMLLAFAACSQNEIIDVRQDSINYAVSTAKTSRAANSYDPTNLPSQFNVWAKTATGTYIENEVIENLGGTWKAKTTRYWPTEALDFVAHVNAGDAFQYNDGVPKVADFIVNNKVAEQTDLMYAVTTGQTKDNTNGTVALNFRHALAQVCFKATTSQTMKVVINSVGVGHVANKATLTYPAATTTGSGATTKATWGPATGNTFYNVELEPPVTIEAGTDEAVNITDIESTTGKRDFSKIMALIPQQQSAWTTSAAEDYDGAYFKIDAKLINVAGKNETTLYEGPIVVPVTINWEQGKRYVYTLAFGSGTGNGGWSDDPQNPKPVLSSINYNVSVDDYVTENGSTDIEAVKNLTLVYDANGGKIASGSTGATVNEVVKDNGTAQVTLKSGDIFTREGFTFMGWSDDKDANTAKYTANASFTFPEGVTKKTLYAVWKVNDTVVGSAADITVSLGKENLFDEGTVVDNENIELTSVTNVKNARVGLMKFDFTVPDGYKVESASLRLVSKRIKSDRMVDVYKFDGAFTESSKFSDIKDAVKTALNTTSSVQFEAKGQSNKDVTDKGIESNYQVVAGWVNTVDVTTYAQNAVGDTSLSLLFARNAKNNTEQICFFTKDAKDVTNKDKNGNVIFTFNKADILPQLTVKFVKKQ